MKHIRLVIPAILFLFLSPAIVFADTDKDLIKAAEKGDLVKVKAALDQGADVNAREKGLFKKSGNTATMLAAQAGQKSVVQELLDRART